MRAAIRDGDQDRSTDVFVYLSPTDHHTWSDEYMHRVSDRRVLLNSDRIVIAEHGVVTYHDDNRTLHPWHSVLWIDTRNDGEDVW